MLSLGSKKSGRLWCFISRDGIGWRSASGNWNRIRPPWMPMLYSERYGNRIKTKAFGWRWSVYEPGYYTI